MGCKPVKVKLKEEKLNSKQGINSRAGRHLTEEEHRKLEECFKKITGSKERQFQLTHLQEYLGEVAPDDFITNMYQLILEEGSKYEKEQRAICMDVSTFSVGVTRMLLSSYANQSHMVRRLANRMSEKNTVTREELNEFFLMIVAVYMESIKTTPQYLSWIKHNPEGDRSTLVEGLLKELNDPELITDMPNDSHSTATQLDKGISEPDLLKFFQRSHLAELLLQSVFHSCFPVFSNDHIRACLPTCSTWEHDDGPSPLNIMSVAFINSHLPPLADIIWYRLYNSHVDGESASGLVENILDKGATLFVIKEKGGHVFGGFMPHPWKRSPHFQGSHGCFVFSVDPVLAIYRSTGKNNSYAYLNSKSKTLPNGLGFGGPSHAWAWWLDFVHGKCHCNSNLTYGCPQLSKHSIFTPFTVEVWLTAEWEGAEEIPEPQLPYSNKTEARALLHMTGKELHAGGFSYDSTHDDRSDHHSRRHFRLWDKHRMYHNRSLPYCSEQETTLADTLAKKSRNKEQPVVNLAKKQSPLHIHSLFTSHNPKSSSDP